MDCNWVNTFVIQPPLVSTINYINFSLALGDSHFWAPCKFSFLKKKNIRKRLQGINFYFEYVQIEELLKA